jgi:hypothetical protein
LLERDVLADGAVEEEVVLHHHADVRAVVAKLHVRDVLAVDEDAAALGMVERHDQADERALPEPLEPTSAVVEPASAENDTCLSTGTSGTYSNETS